mmetsp:Transcript_48522/g.136507  ORF Transcript_48522/g.136507 Transcript_48522/m.136507 type:complete len:225 (+) Transcript_48522:445-1119(+)
MRTSVCRTPAPPAPARVTEGKACRICLLEGSTDDNPLLRPCECRGSIERVHVGCLREWTKSRLNLDECSLGSFSYKPQTCELCKAALPTLFTSASGERAPLVELPRPTPPFIVLDSTVGDRRERVVHAMSLAGKPATIGRGSESTFRIPDVSISRCHASIAFMGGSFVLHDLRSKAARGGEPLDGSSRRGNPASPATQPVYHPAVPRYERARGTAEGGARWRST